MLTNLLLLKLKRPIDYQIVCNIFLSNYLTSTGSNMEDICKQFCELTENINNGKKDKIESNLKRIKELCK